MILKWRKTGGHGINQASNPATDEGKHIETNEQFNRDGEGLAIAF